MKKTSATSVEEYWNRPDTISLKDENLRRLESGAVSRWLNEGATVLDIGCGDGVNTVIYAEKVQNITGIDYSAEMITRAKRRIASSGLKNVELRPLSVLELEQISECFDVVISQRCLINLSSFPEQRDVIKQVRSMIKPGGLYLMLEAVEQGRESLNTLRGKVGLGPLSMPWHNAFFDEAELHPLLDDLFEIVEVEDFSLYYLITRTLNELMKIGLDDPISGRLDEAAERLQNDLSLNNLAGIGPQRLYILRTRDR